VGYTIAGAAAKAINVREQLVITMRVSSLSSQCVRAACHHKRCFQQKNPLSGKACSAARLTQQKDQLNSKTYSAARPPRKKISNAWPYTIYNVYVITIQAALNNYNPSTPHQ
jgi:hypothetical protein